jgi:hypothetical protein
MEQVPPIPTPSRPVASQKSRFREWRNFLIAFALFLVVILGYMWLAQKTLPASSQEPPRPQPRSATASQEHLQSGVP